MYAVALMDMTYVWRIQDVLTPLAAIKFPTLIGLLALVTYSFDRRKARAFRQVHCRIVILLFAFASIIAAGVPTSLLASGTLEFLLKVFLPNVLLAVLVGACVRGKRDLDWLLGMHLLGAFVFGLYILFFFDVDATGRLGRLIYYDANDLALATIGTLPVVIYFLRDRAPRWQRHLALLVAPVLVLNFIRAGSRGGFLGLITIGLCLIFSYRPVKLSRRISAVALCLIAISAIGGDSFWAKMRTLLAPNEDYNITSETGRWQIWQNGLSIIVQRPFLGVGAGRFPQAEATLSDLGRQRAEGGDDQLPWQAAHNSYLSVAAETGLFGLAMFISLFVTSIGTALRLIRQARACGSYELAALARALAIALIGYVVSASFLTAEYQAILYLNFGLVIATRKLVMQAQAIRPAAATVNPLTSARPCWQPNAGRTA
jgi:O-antigen ligase